MSSATIKDPAQPRWWKSVPALPLRLLGNNAFLAVNELEKATSSGGHFEHIPSDGSLNIPYRATPLWANLGTYRTYSVVNGPAEHGADWSRTNHSILPSRH